MQNVTNDEIAINSVKSKYNPQLITNETVNEYFMYLGKLKLFLIVLTIERMIIDNVKMHKFKLKNT
jgi:hypothetical protein